MSQVPEVRIYFGNLLWAGESKNLAEGGPLLSFEEYEAKTEAYRQAWQPHGEMILTALQDSLGVEFYMPVYDVVCAPYFIPKSEPLIMNFANEPDRFVDALAHEFGHKILTDNKRLQIHHQPPQMDLIGDWKEMFGKEHDFNTLVHIPVQALMKHLYLDIFKDPSRLQRDIAVSAKFTGADDYVKSWQYVNEHDYKEIIAGLKRSYEVIA